jgi:hypothetical protein
VLPSCASVLPVRPQRRREAPLVGPSR